MKIAAYQAPLLKHGSMDALEHIKKQISICEKKDVEILCCPEAVLGGLADDVKQPLKMACPLSVPMWPVTVAIICPSYQIGSYNKALCINSKQGRMGEKEQSCVLLCNMILFGCGQIEIIAPPEL